MKALKKPIRLLILLFCLICAIQFELYSQNQSMMLPFSGDTYPNATGYKMINFNSISSPVVTTLPKHPFDFGLDPGDPHNEDHLQAATLPNPFSVDEIPNYYLMNKYYLGQHPMFAQTVVHDKDGNLLFFIVDNNIYNRNGEAFQIDPADESAGFYYLHDNVFGPNYNRFGFSNPTDISESLDPEIIVYPIYDNATCYKFGLVYSMFDRDNGQGGSNKFYCRTLTYIDDAHITMTDPELLNMGSGCGNFSIRTMAISEYRPNNTYSYLLFVRYYYSLLILPINNQGVIDDVNKKEIQINVVSGMSMLPLFSSEMEVKKVNDNIGDYYYVAM
ncbi:MAG: hypothetical protein WCL06_15520, partial [Bacteroidota bacterium]